MNLKQDVGYTIFNYNTDSEEIRLEEMIQSAFAMPMEKDEFITKMEEFIETIRRIENEKA